LFSSSFLLVGGSFQEFEAFILCDSNDVRDLVIDHNTIKFIRMSAELRSESGGNELRSLRERVDHGYHISLFVESTSWATYKLQPFDIEYREQHQFRRIDRKVLGHIFELQILVVSLVRIT
jgi:hypothetical protein